MAYAVYEENMPRLLKKVTRIKNKCAKYGCDFRFEEVGEEFRTFTENEGTEQERKITRRFVLVEAEGLAQMNGWRFVASLDHTPKGNVINKAVDDIEVPARYYDSLPFCEHCGNTRLSHSFIVVNDEGEFKQVGRSCLNDFTHGMSAEGVTFYASLFDDIIEAEEPKGGYWGDGREYIERDEWLAYVAETIRAYGYIKREEENDTIGTAMGFWNADHGKIGYAPTLSAIRSEQYRIGFNPKRAESILMVAKALEWLETQSGESNYMHNLKTVCSMDYLEKYQHTGISASLFPTWNKDLERKEAARKEAEANKASEWVGKVGERITFEVSDWRCVTSWETEWGCVGIFKIISTDGNVFTWKTSGYIPDKVKTITGTVKEHKEYRGTKQTEVTRCKCK